jgi:hypothetical protein
MALNRSYRIDVYYKFLNNHLKHRSVVISIFVLFFRTPVPGFATFRHSGLYSKTRQDKLLQNDPEQDNPDYNKHI